MTILLIGTPAFTQPVAQMLAQGGYTIEVHSTTKFLTANHKGVEYESVLEFENTSATLKREVLTRLPPTTPILTCALAVSTTIAASWVAHPERVVGFGLLPPIPEIGTIELARGLQTSAESFRRAENFWQTLGQKPVSVADGAGLIRARIVCAIINEAISALMEQVASAIDIDQAMRLGTNYPHGPLEWGDLIGLETVLGVMEGLQAEWGEDRYRPTPLLRRLAMVKQKSEN